MSFVSGFCTLVMICGFTYISLLTLFSLVVVRVTKNKKVQFVYAYIHMYYTTTIFNAHPVAWLIPASIISVVNYAVVYYSGHSMNWFWVGLAMDLISMTVIYFTRPRVSTDLPA